MLLSFKEKKEQRRKEERDYLTKKKTQLEEKLADLEYDIQNVKRDWTKKMIQNEMDEINGFLGAITSQLKRNER